MTAPRASIILLAAALFPDPGMADSAVKSRTPKKDATLIELLLLARERRDHPKIIDAVERNDLKALKKEISKKNTDDANRSGATALMVAAARGRMDALELLVEKGAGLEIRDKTGNTALMHAVKDGQAEAMQRLAVLGADPQTLNDRGRNLVIEATVNNRPAILKILLKSEKYDPDTRDHEDYNALMWSAVTGNLEAAKILLEHGAKPGTKRKDGRIAADLTDQPKLKSLLRGGVRK